MEKIPQGWKLSIRDDETHRLDKKENRLNQKSRTPEEIEKIKQEIIETHKQLGLNENLKYELFPELFK